VIAGGYTVLLLCGPLAAVATVWASERIGVPYPVPLVALGALLYLIPWIGMPEISPAIVFYVFLPPLVYFAALTIAPDDLRAHARTISLLAVGLVIVTAAAVAGVLVGIAGMPLLAALVAGAVVAPTDPVSATSVFKKLAVPERLSTIAEAEGLTNDGSALVLYGGAVSAVVAGKIQPGHLLLTLAAGPAGGAALGLAIAWLLVRVRRSVEQPLLQITISLATPYLTYAAAEGAHLSGVLAAVAAGVYTGSRISNIYSPGARLQAFAFLDVLVFLLNAVLFTLLGMQLVRQVRWLPGKPLVHYVVVMVTVVAVVIAVRMIWMLSGPAVARLLGRGRGGGVWRERVVVGWAGMRGGVSLAAALAIPLRDADGSPFPYRDVVILVAATVIVATLLLQGVSMPWLLRGLGLKPDDHHTEETKARLKAASAALQWLTDHTDCADGEGTDAATEAVRARYEARVRRLQAATPGLGGPSSATADAEEAHRYRRLRLQMLDVERSVMLDLRRDGRINATLLRSLERDLDLEEARLRGR
jgi:Na+/H+ antiporter